MCSMWYTGCRKHPLLIQLAPTAAQHAALLRTLETCNAACHDSAGTAFSQRCASKVDLEKLVYSAMRQRFGLASHMAIRAIAQVVEAFKRATRVKPAFGP